MLVDEQVLPQEGQCSAVQCSALQRFAVLHSVVQCGAMQPAMAGPGAAALRVGRDWNDTDLIASEATSSPGFCAYATETCASHLPPSQTAIHHGRHAGKRLAAACYLGQG